MMQESKEVNRSRDLRGCSYHSKRPIYPKTFCVDGYVVPKILPTSARLLIAEAGLSVEMIVHDPEEYCNQYYEPPDFDDVDPPIARLDFEKQDILCLGVGGSTPRWRPTALLVVADPTDVGEGFTLTSESKDPNNPDWHIRKLAKHVRERLGSPIEEISLPRGDSPFDIPF
jgi:hypothetical protein